MADKVQTVANADRPQISVEQDLRLQALSMSTGLEINRLQRLKFSDEEELRADADYVISMAEKFTAFLLNGDKPPIEASPI